MGVKAADVLYYMYHYDELRSIIQWKTWHEPVHERDESKEPESLKKSFHFLNKTSRSFSAVIQELHPELLVPIALFYLVLRGLDTVEDDMTIPLSKKEPMLRSFDEHLEEEGWNFDGNGPNEKDRELLVQFQYVVEEFRKIKPNYRAIIKDITKKMGNGMADYANNAEHNANGVATIAEYNLYCHYVAGLVGEGLTRLFVESGLANPILLKREDLQESMGLFLQKTNIIRDIHEDFEDKRRFWPKEIWTKHVDKFDELFDPKNLEKALACSSDMVLDALQHVEDCLLYLAGLKEQSVFNFAAIPQTMAIATLERVFQNPNIFKRNVKISKGKACQIMIESTQNLQVASKVFLRYIQKIRKKNNSKDPNFLKISIACGKIEQYIENMFPSSKPESEKVETKTPEQIAHEKAADAEARHDTFMMFLVVFAVIVFMSITMLGGAYYMGARFDVAIDQLWKGKVSRPDPQMAQEIIRQYDNPHNEL